MPLPNPSMNFTPFDPLSAAELNDFVENIEALQDWSAFAAGVMPGNLIGSWDGWAPANEVWTYASATTINVPSGATSRYSIGDRIRINQTTDKYFAIVGVANTLLTVTAGTDYTVANAAIVDPHYSHDISPPGYPTVFNYTPVWTASSVNPSIGNGSIVGTFQIFNRSCRAAVRILMGSLTTFGTGDYRVSLPVNPKVTGPYDQNLVLANLRLRDSGTATYIGTTAVGASSPANGVSLQSLNVSGSLITLTNVANNAPFTWVSGDNIAFEISFDIA